MKKVDAVILAGGLGRRMDGEDKGLVSIKDKPMLDYVIDKIRPQVRKIIINANRNISRYKEFGYVVYPDEIPGNLGPMAGIHVACMKTDADYLLVVPCDTPNLPEDLVLKLLSSLEKADADVAVAAHKDKIHHIIMLIKPSLHPSIKDFIDAKDRKVLLWYRKHKHVIVEFDEDRELFFNINTKEQVLEFIK